MRRLNTLNSGILGLSILAMVLQLLLSSAHIHGLDGDTFHQVHSSAAKSSSNSSAAHGKHSDLGGHNNHHSHGAEHASYELRLIDQQGYELDKPHTSDRHSDDEHVPWHACDFSLLLGAFASLTVPVTTDIVPPAQTRVREFIAHQNDTSEGLEWRAHGARAPPIHTA